LKFQNKTVVKLILQFSNIFKSFSGINVLKDISFSVYEGEVHALMGENGAGKSTLMNILMGLLSADAGYIKFNGEDISNISIQECLKKGISMIHQEILMVPELSIAQNIFLGKEPSKIIWLREREINRRTQSLFDNLGIELHPKVKMKDLSIAQMQMVEIVKAISNKAKVIIMDEPTSALSDKEVSTLFKIIKDLKLRKVAIIYISHKMEEIYEIADRITILRDGSYIATKTTSELDQKKLISLMVGREIDSIFPSSKSQLGDIMLQIKDLCSTGRFDNISFNVKEGEILGIAGLVGAGRTELARAIAGLDRFNSGTVVLNKEVLNLKSPRDAIASKIAYVSEDRKAFGFIPGMSVTQNLTLASLEVYSKASFTNQNLEEKAAGQIASDLKINANTLSQKVKNLSGGNQQKVVLGKTLLTDPKLVILDEPTRGIDIGAKFEIYKLIRKLSERGISIVLISSELPEVLGLSDRILVLSKGKQKAILSRKEATQENIMHYAIH
jgi:inositol transport system ATP-binding protein